MRLKKHIPALLALMLFAFSLHAQTAEEIIRAVRAKLDKVNDYEASGMMKTDVVFIKAPVARVKVYYKKPGQLRIINQGGISFVPKGSVNISLNTIFVSSSGFDIIDAGKESGTGFRIIKLLPKDENADIVLSTLYVDETQSLVRKSKTTTKENGTYELELTYGKYAEYGLADRAVFSFNTKDYNLPRGVAFDYDDGAKKKTGGREPAGNPGKNKKGKVEITYSAYTINKGVPDSVFQ